MLDVSCLMIDAGFNTLMNLPYHIYFSLFVIVCTRRVSIAMCLNPALKLS